MNRLDLKPENYIKSVLKKAEDDLREIKNRQRHSGVSGLQGYFVQNGVDPQDWDLTETLPDTGSPVFFEFVEVEIIFTATGKQPFPIEDIYLDIFFNGTDESHRATEQPNGFWTWTDGVNTATMGQPDPEFDKEYCDNPLQYRWTMSFNYARVITYYLKAYVAGSSGGTIEVNRVF